MPTTLKLTSGQQRVMDAIAHLWKRGYAPSMQEIADECGFRSLNSVAKYVAELKLAGRIEQASGSYRSVRIVEHSR